MTGNPDREDRPDPRRSHETWHKNAAFPPSNVETEQVEDHLDARTENETCSLETDEEAAAGTLEVTHSETEPTTSLGAPLHPVLSSAGLGDASPAVLPDAERLAELQAQHVLARAALQGENDRRHAAVTKISDAQQTIGRLLQEIYAARVELSQQIMARDDAHAARLQLEEQIRAIQRQIDEITATPEEKARRLARKEKDARHKEWLAKEEAQANELVDFCQTYTRSTDHAGRPTKGFATIHPSNRWVKIPRKDLPKYEAEQTEAIEWQAKIRRDELADEYEQHCKYEKQTFFRDRIQRATYEAAWGVNSLRAKAYRERQRDYGAPESDPPRYEPAKPGSQFHPRPVPAVTPASTPGW